MQSPVSSDVIGGPDLFHLLWTPSRVQRGQVGNPSTVVKYCHGCWCCDKDINCPWQRQPSPSWSIGDSGRGHGLGTLGHSTQPSVNRDLLSVKVITYHLFSFSNIHCIDSLKNLFLKVSRKFILAPTAKKKKKNSSRGRFLPVRTFFMTVCPYRTLDIKPNLAILSQIVSQSHVLLIWIFYFILKTLALVVLQYK